MSKDWEKVKREWVKENKQHTFWKDRNPPGCFHCGKTEEELSVAFIQELLAKQRTQLLARVREEVLVKDNEKLGPPQAVFQAEMYNMRVDIQLKNLKIISEEGK